VLLVGVVGCGESQQVAQEPSGESEQEAQQPNENIQQEPTPAAKKSVEGREPLTLEGHSSQVYSVSFSADGKRIVSGSLDKTVKIWDAEP
jgi:WD40 repeat protein